MGRSDANETNGVAFGDVIAALRRLGGVAHSHHICGLLVQSRGLDKRARCDLELQVRRILAEHEESAQTVVRRVFGSDSNRWRLN